MNKKMIVDDEFFNLFESELKVLNFIELFDTLLEKNFKNKEIKGKDILFLIDEIKENKYVINKINSIKEDSHSFYFVFYQYIKNYSNNYGQNREYILSYLIEQVFNEDKFLNIFQDTNLINENIKTNFKLSIDNNGKLNFLLKFKNYFLNEKNSTLFNQSIIKILSTFNYFEPIHDDNYKLVYNHFKLNDKHFIYFLYNYFSDCRKYCSDIEHLFEYQENLLDDYKESKLFLKNNLHFKVINFLAVEFIGGISEKILTLDKEKTKQQINDLFNITYNNIKDYIDDKIENNEKLNFYKKFDLELQIFLKHNKKINEENFEKFILSYRNNIENSIIKSYISNNFFRTRHLYSNIKTIEQDIDKINNICYIVCHKYEDKNKYLEYFLKEFKEDKFSNDIMTFVEKEMLKLKINVTNNKKNKDSFKL